MAIDQCQENISQSHQPFSLILTLAVSSEIMKLLTLPKLCSFLLQDHSTLQYGHKFLFIESLFWTGRSPSSIFIFRRSFFTATNCWQYFLRKTWRWLCRAQFTHSIASFYAVRGDIAAKLLKYIYNFFLQNIWFDFTWSSYYAQTFPS